ncbi:hypothetical protein CTI12_AA614330 [Artemisia annua]|uniref:Uncharacterized protein n=1 Tax=Artemisia annua TaxID=35608 RepID=A0A2U1KDP1_ARTAN|nr:hypothetical protein CTI12_AA614330 [Artemisia annua]
MEVKSMWEIFRKHGNLVDIYMAKSRLRNGSRFGFLTYKKPFEAFMLEKKINDTWVGSYRIRGFMTGAGSQERREADRRQTRTFGGNFRWANMNNNDVRSYKQVTVGGKPSNPGAKDGDTNYKKVEKTNNFKPTNTETRSIIFSATKEHEVYLESSLIGSAKDVEVLESIGDICDAEGLEDFETKLLGGLEILIKCRNKTVAEDIINDKQHRLHQWVENIRRWDEQWQQNKRVCWIKIQGVPANGWNENLFRQIAEEWGDPHEFENCNFFDSTDLSFGRVLIVTKYWEKINSSKSMLLNGFNRLIRIMEDDNNIKPMEQCSSESEKSWSEKMLTDDEEEVEQHRDTGKEKQKVHMEDLQKEVEKDLSGYGDNTCIMEEEVQATGVKKDAVKSTFEKTENVSPKGTRDASDGFIVGGLNIDGSDGPKKCSVQKKSPISVKLNLKTQLDNMELGGSPIDRSNINHKKLRRCYSDSLWITRNKHRHTVCSSDSSIQKTRKRKTLKTKGTVIGKKKGWHGKLSFHLLKKKKRQSYSSLQIGSKSSSKDTLVEETQNTDGNVVKDTNINIMEVETTSNENEKNLDVDGKHEQVQEPGEASVLATKPCESGSVYTGKLQESRSSSGSKENIKVRFLGEKLGFKWVKNMDESASREISEESINVEKK